MAGPVVEILLELAFDDAALLLDDQHLVLVAHEVERVAAGQRPDHADLVDVDAERAAFGLADAEQAQRLHQVEMALAGRDDAEAGVLDVMDVAVDRIGFGEGMDGLLLGLHAFLDLRPGQVKPAVVQSVGGGVKSGEAKMRSGASSTEAADSTVSEIALKPTHVPEKRDSA